MRKLTFEELAKRHIAPHRDSFPCSALADNIRSLHNVGSLFRSADAVGLQHLYLCGITAHPPRDEIRKTSLGAEESVPWSHHPNPLPLLNELKASGVQLVALELTTESADFRIAPYRFPLCFIVGNEYSGIRDEVLQLCELAVEIPMHGIKHSLNVSVSFGILAYEIRRRWEELQRQEC